MTREEFMVWEEKLEKKEIPMNVEMIEVDGVENPAEMDDVEMMEMNKIELIDADETGTPIDVDDVSMMEMDEN